MATLRWPRSLTGAVPVLILAAAGTWLLPVAPRVPAGGLACEPSGDDAWILQHPDVVEAVAFSPDGRSLAAGSGALSQTSAVVVWDLATKTPRTLLSGHRNDVMAVAFAADGGALASVSFDAVRVWDVDRGGLMGTPPIRPGHVVRVAFDPGGRTVAAALASGDVKLWEVHSGRAYALPPDIGADAVCVAYTPDGRNLAVASRDGVLRLWNPATGVRSAHRLMLTPGELSVIALSPDGRTLAFGGTTGVVTLWDLATDTARGKCAGHDGWVQGLAFSPDGRLLASGSRDQTVRVWTPTAEPWAVFQGHAAPVNAVAFSPDGRTIASGGADKTARIWKLPCDN